MDVIFISYTEPNADINYNDLLTKFPYAKRVHGVTGIYEAYYKASKLNSSDCFITIDGDTVVWDNLKDIEFNFTNDNQLIRYPTKNNILGIVNASGSIKCWHKNSFNYITKDNFDKNVEWYRCDNIELIDNKSVCVGETIVNASPKQAFTVAFREAFKFFNIKSHRVDHCIQWCSKHDVINGDWATLGARTGLLYAIEKTISLQEVNDWRILDAIFNDANLENATEHVNIFLKRHFQLIFKDSFKLTNYSE